MNTDGNSQETGSGGLTEDQAAERFAQMLSADEDGDSDEGETQEDEESSEAADDDEAETSDDDAEQSEDDAEEGDGDEEQPATYTVKIDGEEVQVTLDEALKGYQRDKDYSRKTMALAEQRKAVDAEKATAAQDREAYRQALTKMEAFFASADQDDSAALDALRHTDPAEFAARVVEKQRLDQQRQALKDEQARLDALSKQEQAELQQRQRAEYLQAEEAKLIDAIPEWKSADKRAADTKQIADYAASIGVPPEELDALADSRLVIALRDAAKWRALQAKKPAVQAKVDAVKTAKPGSATQKTSKVTDLTRSKQRLAKTGRVEDAAAVFLRSLG